MPANLDARLLNDPSFTVWIPIPGMEHTDICLWLSTNGQGRYFRPPPRRETLLQRKEEWLFSDSATAMHFKIKFG